MVTGRVPAAGVCADGDQPPLVIVLGPTASGKSALAVALAERMGGEVLNADSRQIYRGLDIGTAKPTAAERRGIPHHLFDLVEPEQAYSAAAYRAHAVAAARDVSDRGKLPIVVGGTGLYLRVLRHGIFDGPGRSAYHDRLDAVAARGGLGRLHRWLGRVDPAWAARVGSGDRQRVLRALDVYLQTGLPMSEHIRRARPARLPFDVLTLGCSWPRPALYGRIDRRVDEMVRAGLLDEVRRARARPGFAGANAAKAVGYRQLGDYLGGRTTLDHAIEKIKRDTRRLAKRQMTWFGKEPDVCWLPAGDSDELVATGTASVRAFFARRASAGARRRGEAPSA